MRKLIEKTQEQLVVCDNPACSYQVPYHKDVTDNLKLWIDKPCPMCGDNLLTEEDYEVAMKIECAVNFINKWFSWITIFMPKDAEYKKVRAHVHDGVKIKVSEE